MKVTQKQVDDLTLMVTLTLTNDDYAPKIKKILNDYRKTAEIKGFRKGMVPFSLIEKMHGQSAMVDAVNGLISDGLHNHITENKLNIIGEPLANETEQKPVNWKPGEEMEFIFDVALAPKVNISLSSEDKIVYNQVKPTKTELSKYRSNILKQFGNLAVVDSIEHEEDIIIADISQGENIVEATYIALRSIEDKDIKDQFIGKRAGDNFEVDVNRAFANETDRAAMLKIKKEDLASVEPIWQISVKEIKRFAEAEPNQELFDRMYGEGAITTQEEFNAKIEERMIEEYGQESDYKFMLDAREYLIEKAAIAVPEEFLKRWLFTVNDGKFTIEEIEKDFHLFLKDFRWQLIREFLMKEQGIKVERDDLLKQAKGIAAYQFAMYGLPNVPEEQLNQYAESLLANEKEGRRIFEKVEEDKVIEYVKSVVTLEKKSVSAEKLKELTN